MLLENSRDVPRGRSVDPAGPICPRYKGD